MNKLMKLSQLGCGESAQIFKIVTDENTRNRYAVMGVAVESEVTRLFTKRKGPASYLVNGILVEIHDKDASNIYIAKKLDI